MNHPVRIVHPASGTESVVSRSSFDRRSSRLGWVLAPEPTEPDPAPEPPADEEAELRAFLEGHGVVVDGRWRLKRLRTEAAVFEEPI